MSSKRKYKINLWIGGVAGFLLGVCGNLVATWLQQDIFMNSFTPIRIGIIILCSIVGIFIMIISDMSKTTPQKPEKVNGNNFYSRIKLAWSKFRTKGRGIHAEDISSIGSEIDIDTK